MPEPQRLPLPDASLLLYSGLSLGNEETVMRRLIDGIHWRQEYITLFGKTHKQPRLVAWYGDRNAVYTYSGKAYTPRPWTEELLRLRDLVEVAAASRFNSVLLNYYRDGRDAMGLHADDEPELGPEPVIASLSLGATRKLYFQHRFRRDLDTVTLPLQSGSLLVMGGQTQRYWKHGLRKTSRACEPRINLTFRYVFPESS